MNDRQVWIDYTNYRGERREYLIEPLGWRHGANKWHTTPQWLIRARDVDRGVEREFAMNDIHSWRQV